MDTVLTGNVPDDDVALLMSRVEAGVKEAIGSLIVNFGSYGKGSLVEQKSLEEHDRLLQEVRGDTVMKHLYLNLKRFDVPVEYGGVNRIARAKDFGAATSSPTPGGPEALRPQPGGVRPSISPRPTSWGRGRPM